LHVDCGGGGATQPFPRDGGVEKLHGDPTLGPRPQGLDQRSKMKDVVPKMERRKAQMRDNPERDEINSAEGVRRRCKKLLLLFDLA